MACKRCGDPAVSSEYRCYTCDVAVGKFKWCVITRITNSEGNEEFGKYDATIDFKDVVDVMDTKTGQFYNFFENAEGIVHFKDYVFEVGELIPLSDAFGRELVGPGRKPGKWDVEYEIFPGNQYKEALKLAIKVSKDAYKEKTNLDLVEDKYVAKQELTEKKQQLKTAEDPFKLVYGWIKQGTISLKESKVLLGEVYKHVKQEDH
jgi:hypothetical protein